MSHWYDLQLYNVGLKLDHLKNWSNINLEWITFRRVYNSAQDNITGEKKWRKNIVISTYWKLSEEKDSGRLAIIGATKIRCCVQWQNTFSQSSRPNKLKKKKKYKNILTILLLCKVVVILHENSTYTKYQHWRRILG